MTIIDLGALDGAELVEPVSLSEAKAWARIERDDEDALIAGLIRAARQAVEAMTGLVLAQRGFRLALDPGAAGRLDRNCATAARTDHRDIRLWR